jgi:hypothetical protein
MGIFLFTTASEPALGPTQPPIQWVLVALSLGVKRPGIEADHSPPSSAEVKECVDIRGCTQKFPDWPPGERTENDTGAVISLFCESV